MKVATIIAPAQQPKATAIESSPICDEIPAAIIMDSEMQNRDAWLI